MSMIKPNSVVDIGCGTGTWLNAFSNECCPRILGLDGAWVPVERLAIPKDCFITENLVEPTYKFDTPFDLAISLEVAEHIDINSSQEFVNFVVGAARLVLWSAAIPYQGGTGHVNEQFPDFWFNLFRKKGYVCFDVMRSKFWQDPEVAWYYAQNMFLYAHHSLADNLARSFLDEPNVDTPPLSLVHPHRYLNLVRNVYYPQLIHPKKLLQSAWRSLRYRFKEKIS